MHRNRIERIKDFSWRCAHGSKTHLLLVLTCTPIAKILSLQLSPLKGARDPWKVIKSTSCGRRIRIDLVYFVTTRKHECSQGWCDMDKWASLKDFTLMNRCQVKHQKREKRILQKPTRTRWYSKTTNNMIYTRKVYFISLGNISWKCYTCPSNLRSAEFPEVKVSSKMLHKVF